MSRTPDFFRKRESDQLGLESFMSAALQASAQRQAAAQASQANQLSGVGGEAVTSAAQGQADVDTAAKIAELQQQLGGKLGKNATQTMARLPKGTKDTASATAAAKFKYETQKQEAFNQAIADGNLEEAMAIDPISTQELLKQQQQMQIAEQNMQLEAAKVQASLENPKVQESALQKAQAKKHADMLSKINEEATQGATSAARIDNIIPLLDKIYTGAGGEKVQAYRNLMAYINPSKDTTDDAAIGSQIKNLSNDMTVDLLQRYSGAISNVELKEFMSATVGLGQTPEANRRIAMAVQAGNLRQVQRKQFFDAYRAKFGDDIDGASGAWDTYILTTPAFTTDPASGTVTINQETWREYLDSMQESKDYMKASESTAKPTREQIVAELKKRGKL